MSQVNPYAAPIDSSVPEPLVSAGSGDDLGDCERIRRAHLTAETNIKTIGALALLGAVAYALMLVPLLFRAMQPMVWVFSLLLTGGMSALFWWMGTRLRALESAGRTAYTVVAILGLIFTSFAAVSAARDSAAALASVVPTFLFVVLFMWILWNGKAAVVFSDDYRLRVVPATPHIKYRTSSFVRIALGVLVGLVAMGIIAAIMM